MARNDLSKPETIELCPGLTIDTKIKMGAVWWLEDKYDKSIGEINFAGGRVKDMANLVVALAMQHDPKLTEKKAAELFKQLDLDQLAQLSDRLGSLFDVKLLESEAKNSPKASPPKTKK